MRTVALPSLMLCIVFLQNVLSAATPEYAIEQQVISEGYDRTTCWVHLRGGFFPNGTAVFVTQKLTLTGSDVFDAIHSMESTDGGRTFSEPLEQPTLSRRQREDGRILCPCDATPAWHKASGTMLLIGHMAVYESKDEGKTLRLASQYRPGFFYAVYDETSKRFGKMKSVEFLPDSPLYNGSPGCVQRYDLADGTILVPLSVRKNLSDPVRDTVVVRCSFDGKEIKPIDIGKPIFLSLPAGRGLYEPSVVGFDGKFFLTMRNDVKGYVSVSSDGLNYSEPIPWRWEDGEEIGNYNTQQHWVRGGGNLYLVYTRRAENNGHVFRHRAPLFIAQVDPQGPNLIRNTERIAVPEHGARLGNFGITHVNDQESWATVTEWMQGPGGWLKCEEHGANNRLWQSRFLWQK